MASGCYKSIATITKPTGESDTRWETCGSKVSRQKAVPGKLKNVKYSAWRSVLPYWIAVVP